MGLPRPNLAQIARQPTTGQIAQSVRVPASVGGWNQYDSIAAMAPEYALTLDNVFPSVRQCTVRPGYTVWGTGLGTGAVETLMQWGGPSSEKLLAAANGNIYNVSTAGAGTSLGSGYTNNRWQHTNMGTAGGHFVIAVNGADTPINYNGTAIATTPAITGVTATNLIHVWQFQNRLFFLQKNSLVFAYLPVNVIGGAALTFDLSALFEFGGYLICAQTWSRAGLTDQEDLCVFLTSEGEFAVYSGTDPGDATKWALQNRGRIGAPPTLGTRSMEKIGSDLYIVCQDGLVALSQVLWLDRVDTSKTISQKIGTAVNDAVAAYSANFGFEIFLYPKGNMVMVNVPALVNKTMYQYVANTATGAWCRFTGLNANCWQLFNNSPYFGGVDGTVYKWDSGSADNGALINWEIRSAFVNMGEDGQNKLWTLVRPIFESNGPVSFNYRIEVDYSISNLTQPSGSSSANDSRWDTALWDTAPWDDSAQIVTVWLGANALGRVCDIHMRGASMNQDIAWIATDFTFYQGGLL